VLLLILVGAGSFFGGVKYQQSKRNSTAQFLGGRDVGNRQQGGVANNRNGNGFRPVAGQILAMDNQSITVKLADGSSKIVILSGNTVYNKTQAGSLSDLKVGDNISVFGTTNTDGSVTAQNIQIGALFGGMGGIPSPAQGR
jgi:hypothetical protein